MDAWRTSTGVAATFASCSPFAPSAFADAHGLCTDAQRTGNGHQTGGRRAGIRLMPTFCDIPRWAAARGGWTCQGRETDTPRATHGRFPYGRTTGGRRTGDGHQTGGRWAGIRLMPTFCDIPRWAAARGGWTCQGLITDDSPTDGQRTGDGRRARGDGHGLLTGGGSPDRIAAIFLNWNQSYIKIMRLPMQGVRERSQSIVNLSREGKGWVGICPCAVCFLSIFRRGKGGWAFVLVRFAFCLYLEGGRAGICFFSRPPLHWKSHYAILRASFLGK